MDDQSGLDAAYATEEGTYTAGDTLYVAGTKSFGDAVDDLSIPFGLTNLTTRYRDAAMILNANPQRIRTVVGHSLGGAVALQLQKEDPTMQTRTYGAPVASLTPSTERYKELGDPISIFDFGAYTTRPKGLNPHSYGRLAHKSYPFSGGISTEIR